MTLNMGNIDRALNIYQGVSLAKISALNKKALAAQYANIEQITELKKSLSREIDAINRTNKKILELQLKELEHKEAIKFYRQIAYKAKEGISIIDEEEDLMVKSYLLEIYSLPLSFVIRDAKSNLEEFNDKEYCSLWENKLNSNILQAQAVEEQYLTSSLHLSLSKSSDYNTMKSNLLDNIKKIGNEIKNTKPFVKEIPDSKSTYLTKQGIVGVGCASVLLLFCLLVFVINLFGCDNYDILSISGISIWIIFPIGLLWLFLIRKRKLVRVAEKDYPLYRKEILKRIDDGAKLHEESMNTLQDNLIQTRNELEELETSHPYIIASRFVSQNYNDLDSIMNRIEACIPKDLGIQNNKKEDKEVYDSLLKDVAREIVKSKIVMASSIQRRHRIGYNRANLILDQLESIGVLGPANIGKCREILIKDLNELEQILKDIT